MPDLAHMKAAFQQWLRPWADRLAARGLSANDITVGAVLLSLAAGGLMLWSECDEWSLFLLPIALMARYALTTMAEMIGQAGVSRNPMGVLLNELGDVVSEIALYLPVAMVPRIQDSLVLAVVLTAMLAEMTGVVGVLFGASRRQDGPMGKNARALVFGFLGFMLGAGALAGDWTHVLLYIVLFLSIYTVYNRARAALREAK